MPGICAPESFHEVKAICKEPSFVGAHEQKMLGKHQADNNNNLIFYNNIKNIQ